MTQGKTAEELRRRVARLLEAYEDPGHRLHAVAKATMPFFIARLNTFTEES